MSTSDSVMALSMHVKRTVCVLVFLTLQCVAFVNSRDLLTSTLVTFEEFVCDYNYLDVTCPKETAISIQFAHYGRQVPNSEMCPPRAKLSDFYGNSRADTNCLATSSLEVLLDVCENKRHCFLHATTTTFGKDPCPGTSKYLEVAYKCVPKEFRSKVACENQQMHLRCQKSTRIFVYKAMFGRFSQGHSECPSTGIGDTECQSEAALDQVVKRCHGRRHCAMTANTRNFGEPCSPGTYKYLIVVYTCVPKRVMKKGFNIESLFTTPSTTVTSTTIPTTKIRHDNHGGRGGKNNGRGRSPDSSHPVDPTSNPRDEDYFYEGGGNSGPELSGENNENEQRGRHNSGYDLNNGKSPSGSADKLPAYVNTKFQHVLFTESPSREKATPKASEPATTSSPNMSTFTICINYTEGIHIAESKTRGDRDHIGFVVDWINTKQYLDSNQEKLILYLVVSLCIGLILVLLAIIVRLSYVHRKHKRVKLDISEPVANHRLTPSRDLNFDLYSNYDNFDVGLDPGPVRFHGRNTLRGDDEPGERSLNNYYG